jgi:hypothetical protein
MGDEMFERTERRSLPSETFQPGDRAILQGVETGLTETMGASAESATLYFVESIGGMKPSMIPSDPDGFADALRKIFGHGSAELLKSILKELRLRQSKSGRDERLHDFVEAMEKALKSVETGVI